MRLVHGIEKEYDKSILDGNTYKLIILRTPTGPNEFVHEIAASCPKTGKLYLLTEKTTTLDETRKEIETKLIALAEIKEIAESLKLPRDEMDTFNFVFDDYKKQLTDLGSNIA